MTTLAITPNWKNKSARFKGTVAAGEHVSVTILNDDGEGGEFIADASTLRLRVVDPCNGRTLAIFPEPVPEGETPETWDADLSPLRCTLNLNTVQMLKAVPPAANVPLLWVLDDYDNKTLYFKEQFEVTHWPRLRGEEEPTDLDNYKDIIADFNTRLDGYDSRIIAAENAAQAATENASAANDTADESKTIANEAVDVAQQAKEAAETSQESAAASATAAQNAANDAIAAAESINNPDATLTEEGVAADAKATGERIAAERTRAEAAEATEKARAEGVESGLDTRLTAAEKAIDDEATLRAAADADLEANKADKATTYTKTEVDSKIAGVQTFKKYLVQTLPDPDEADMKGLYLVPTGETSEEGDLCEEWTVVEENGEKRWEKIGVKAVDLTLDDAVTRTSPNGVKSSGIWSALWGALAALPTGITSLYDWCVAQLGLKRDYTDLSYDTTETVEVPALHATMTSQQSEQVIVEYDLLCTEEVPDPPQIGHVYTWREDGAAFYVTQGVSALQTTWTLYSYAGDVLGGVTTQNATQGFYPDVEFRPSNAVITIHKTTAQKQVTTEDTIALESKTVPTSRTVNGKALTGNVTLTGADIAVSGTDATKISAALAGKATKADATLTERGDPSTPGFSAWTIDGFPSGWTYSQPAYNKNEEFPSQSYWAIAITSPEGDTYNETANVADPNAVELNFGSGPGMSEMIATRTALQGYQLGNDDQHILASEAEAEALRQGKQNALSAQQLANIAAVSNALAFDAAHTYAAGDPVVYNGTLYTFTAAHTGAWTGSDVSAVDIIARLAGKLDKSGGTMTGNLTMSGGAGIFAYASGAQAPGAGIDGNGVTGNSFTTQNVTLSSLTFTIIADQTYSVQLPLGNGILALKGNIPYSLGTPTVISTASSETVEGETVNYGAAKLANRTANIVQVTAATALDELRITFPAATSGKVRDFGLRVEIGTGSAALAAPALVPVAPPAETIKIENNAKEIPALADGTATAKGVTLLYFSEIAPGVFVVKGEQVEEVA